MSDQTIILLASLAAGVAGTGLGGLLGVFLGYAGRGFLPRVLGFAGGIMVGVSLFDLVPQSFSSLLAGGLKTQTALICLICSVGAGAVAVALAEKLSDAIMWARHKTFAASTTKEKSVVQTVSPLSRRAVISAIADAQNGTTAKSMLRTGIIMAIAIALHNFPEGLAIGAAGSAETAGGIAVALTIALHNVPEGMSVAAPLAGGGVKKDLPLQRPPLRERRLFSARWREYFSGPSTFTFRRYVWDLPQAQCCTCLLPRCLPKPIPRLRGNLLASALCWACFLRLRWAQYKTPQKRRFCFGVIF